MASKAAAPGGTQQAQQGAGGPFSWHAGGIAMHAMAAGPQAPAVMFNPQQGPALNFAAQQQPGGAGGLGGSGGFVFGAPQQQDAMLD